MKSRHKRIRVGDYFAINLDNSYAIGQYVYFHHIYGTLVRITDYLLSDLETFDIEEADTASNLFPPIFTFLTGAISDGIWKRIGHSAIVDFAYPSFISYFSGKDRFEANHWFLEKDGKVKKLGSRLPKQYLNLEVLVIWSIQELTSRIQTGVNPYDKAKYL